MGRTKRYLQKIKKKNREIIIAPLVNFFISTILGEILINLLEENGFIFTGIIKWWLKNPLFGSLVIFVSVCVWIMFFWKDEEQESIPTILANNSKNFIAGVENIRGDIEIGDKTINHYGEIVDVDSVEYQTIAIDYGVVLIKVLNKTGYTLYECYAELEAVKWDGDNYFTKYESRLFWIDKHIEYNGYEAVIRHEDYWYVGVGEKNSHFKGNARFYAKNRFARSITEGTHIIRLKIGGETKTGKAVVHRIETNLVNYVGERMQLGDTVKIMDI